VFDMVGMWCRHGVKSWNTLIYENHTELSLRKCILPLLLNHKCYCYESAGGIWPD
jgi:hypothetical protein